jgi:ADP-L-glycero-D-manno-heptose 6-epimerase
MNRIVVTGAAGFIGSNIIKALNARGLTDIIAVDDLTQADKFINLARVEINEYVDAEVFYKKFSTGKYGSIDAVFHEGACSDTMETNGKYVMANNYELSCQLFLACQDYGARLIYASSAATYGNSVVFREEAVCERPLNVYGYSKLLFDQKMRSECFKNNVLTEQVKKRTQVVGLRYFNVYGPHEQHKGRMASVAYHQFHQFQKEGFVKLFDGYGGYAAGEQMRDFVSVDDVVAVNLWFFDHPEASGIFNLGTGRAQTFNDISYAVINTMRRGVGKKTLSLKQIVQQKLIEYIEFPETLRGKYQCHTEADLTRLRAIGCDHNFGDVRTGVAQYVEWLLRNT